MEIEKTPVLICGNHKGYAQFIRMLFYLIGVPFTEVHVNIDCQLEKKQDLALIPEGLELVCQRMPYLVDSQVVVCESVPVALYICRKFDREDLLGQTIKDKSRVSEILYTWHRSKCQMRQHMMEMGEKIKADPENRLQILKEGACKVKAMGSLMKPIFGELAVNQKYVTSSITVADLILFQSTFYVQRIFGHLLGQCPFFKRMMTYRQRFEEEEQWYKAVKTHLESFKIAAEGVPKDKLDCLNMLMGEFTCSSQ